MARRAVERHVSALVEAGMNLASELDLDTLLQRIADLAREVVGAAYGAVGVVGEKGELSRFVYSGFTKEQADKIGDLPRGRGVLGALLEERRPLRLHEISDHPRSYGFPANHPPMHTFLGVPIVVRGNVFGRLYLTEKHGGGDFTKDDERIAMTFAAQAGVAIENARLYEEVQERGAELTRRMKELSSVERVGDLLISGTSIDELLRSAVGEALVLTDATKAVLLLLDETTGDLVIHHAGGDIHRSDFIGTRLGPASSKGHGVIARGRGEIVDDIQSDPEIHSETIEKLGRPRSGAFAPMVIESRGLGVLAVYDRKSEGSFSSDDLAILQLLANQVAIALENDRLTEALRDLAVLEERERIAKELHDGVIQSIYSVGLALQGSTSLMKRDPELAAKRIDQAIAELDNVVRDVRSYIFELRPKMIDEHGFAAAITELVKDFEVNTLAHATLELQAEGIARLSKDEEFHVVQIVREILSNVARHAQAAEVRITLEEARDGAIELAITDDGVGFDVESVVRGHGLRNIEERARKLGGTLSITPGPDKGTRHHLQVPTKSASDV